LILGTTAHAEYVPNPAFSAATDQLRASLIARLQDGCSAN
jgi:hypothetical protein